jgi:HK97 family phage major capsid protein
MADMQAIIDGAAGRALTAEEVTAYEGFEAEIETVRTSNAVAARHAAYNTTVVPAGRPSPNGPKSDGTYNQAFNHYARTGKVNADLEAPTNAQSEGVPSEGGYLVPDEFRQKLVKKLKAFGGIGRKAERYNTGNGRPVEWPVEGDDTANEGEIVQEGNTFTTGADLTFDTNALGSYSYVAGGAGGVPLRVSWELAQDSAFDLEGMISNKLGKRIARMQARHWVRGNGATEPLGITTGRTPVQTAANNALTFADFVTWIHSLDPAYRGRPGMEEDGGSSPEWWFNDAFLKQAQLITDSHGDPIYRGWGANMALGFNEETLFGYPVNIDQSFVDFDNDDSTDLFGVFGDVGQGYVIRDVKQATLLVNPYTRQSYRQNEYTLWARADGTQQDTNAYIVMSGKS